jgi:hypothetical protein
LPNAKGQAGDGFARGARGVGADALRAEVVGEVIEDVVGRVAAGDALAAEEDVFVNEVAGEVGFVEGVTVVAVPIERAAGLLNALAVAVVFVRDSRGSDELVFGVVGVS